MLQRIQPPSQDLAALADGRIVLRMESLQLSADALRDSRLRYCLVSHMVLEEFTLPRWGDGAPAARDHLPSVDGASITSATGP